MLLNPHLVYAQFGLGAYNYYADNVSLLVKGLRSLMFLPGGKTDKGLAHLQDVEQRGRSQRTTPAVRRGGRSGCFNRRQCN